VKTELVGMVDGLSPGTFFNIIVFERDVDVFQAELVVATQDNKQAVTEWMGPYWRLEGSVIERRGTFRRNYQPVMTDWPSDGGSSRMDLALASAFQMGADLIFMITDGTPSIQLGWTDADQAEWETKRVAYERERATYVESAAGKRETADYEIVRAAWQKRRDAETADRARKGLPPEVREGGSRGAPAIPGPRPPSRSTGYYSADDIVKLARRFAEKAYGRDNRDWPTVNVVGYSANKRAEDFIKKLDAGFPDSSWRNIGLFKLAD
jgi:hypothetical protein